MASNNMFLYWGSGSPPCWRVMLTLQEKDIRDYPNKLLEFSKKEHKSEDVMKLNPRGQVPTFRHGDIVINESLAIIDYLEHTFCNQGTKLLPDDPAQRALVLQREFEHTNLYKKGTENLVYYLSSTKKEDQDEKLIAQRKQLLLEELQLWEGYLEKLGANSHIAGKDFTMADIVFFPQLAFLVRSGFKLAPRFPLLKSYYDKLCERPSVQATWPPHWKETPDRDLLAAF